MFNVQCSMFIFLMFQDRCKQLNTLISPILIIFGVKVPHMEKLGNPKFFCSRTPRGGVLWTFQILAFLAHLQFLNDHILASTNDRRLVLVSNIKFWNELSEKIYEIFFGAQKSHFFAKMGPFWVPVTPSKRKFDILTLPYHFHIKFMLESTKKNMVSNLYEGAIDFQSFYCNMQMRFLAKTAKKQL